MAEDKSVLDNILRKTVGAGTSPARPLRLVGTCLKCGAPIYGPDVSFDPQAEVRFTCGCQESGPSCRYMGPVRKTIEDTMHTK